MELQGIGQVLFFILKYLSKVQVIEMRAMSLDFNLLYWVGFMVY